MKEEKIENHEEKKVEKNEEEKIEKNEEEKVEKNEEEKVEKNEEENNNIKELNDPKKIIEQIVDAYGKLGSYIENEIKNSFKNIDFDIKNDKNNNINNINNTKDNRAKKPQDVDNHIKEIVKKLITIYDNKHIQKINELIEKLRLFIEFEPPSMDNYSNKSNELKSESSTNTSSNENVDEEIFFNLYNINNDGDNDNVNNLNHNNVSKTNTINLFCFYCKIEEAKYYCNHCCRYSCEICFKEKLKDDEEETDHKFIMMDNKKIENEENKQIFLKSFFNVIKKYILKSNYIIKNENQDYVNPFTFEKLQYPSIRDEDNWDYQKEFFISINYTYDIIKKEIDFNKSINEKELCFFLLNLFNDMFKDQILWNQVNLDDNYSDEYGEGSESEEKDDETKEKENEEKIKENGKNENDTITKTKDKFDYIVNTIINFIRSKKFEKLSPKDIRNNYKKLPSLYHFKIIIDGIIRLRSKIPVDYLDYKYNSIIPNLSLKNASESEICKSPYEWAEIGLNVFNKYANGDWLKKNNDKWAIAYYGFGKSSTSEEIGKMLNDIVVKGEFKRELSAKSTELDIRHNGERIEEGIYLSPNVKIAEEYSGIFNFNNKEYKIVLMAKVLVENIREPKDHSFWILNKGDIRIYKILVKEKK